MYKRETPLSDDQTLMIAQEENILRIKNFIEKSNILQDKRQIDKENLFLYKNPFISPFEYDEVSLRAKLFSFIEEFFCLVKGGDICGLISITPPIVPPTTSAIIKIVIAPKDLFREFLKYAQDNLPFISIKNITKIRVNEITSERLEPEFEKVLLEEGYKEEGIMEHELGFSNHLRSLVKYYSEAFIEKVEQQKIWEVKR